eukprot:4919227-Amphidinium_carterae.1
MQTRPEVSSTSSIAKTDTAPSPQNIAIKASQTSAQSSKPEQLAVAAAPGPHPDRNDEQAVATSRSRSRTTMTSGNSTPSILGMDETGHPPPPVPPPDRTPRQLSNMSDRSRSHGQIASTDAMSSGPLSAPIVPGRPFPPPPPPGMQQSVDATMANAPTQDASAHMPPLPMASMPWTPSNQVSSFDLLELIGLPQPDASIIEESSTSTRSRSRSSRERPDRGEPEIQDLPTQPNAANSPAPTNAEEQDASPTPSTRLYPSDKADSDVQLPIAVAAAGDDDDDEDPDTMAAAATSPPVRRPASDSKAQENAPPQKKSK